MVVVVELLELLCSDNMDVDMGNGIEEDSDDEKEQDDEDEEEEVEAFVQVQERKGKSIFDEDAFQQSFDTPVLAGSHSSFMEEGAVFGIRGTLRF